MTWVYESDKTFGSLSSVSDVWAGADGDGCGTEGGVARGTQGGVWHDVESGFGVGERIGIG